MMKAEDAKERCGRDIEFWNRAVLSLHTIIRVT
jgi:hypothetical protein